MMEEAVEGLEEEEEGIKEDLEEEEEEGTEAAEEEVAEVEAEVPPEHQRCSFNLTVSQVCLLPEEGKTA
jgi:hypothetical protein